MKGATRQEGYLFQKSGSWLGRYRKLHQGKREQVSLKLGSVADLTEEQARAKLKSIINADMARLPLLRRIGSNGMLAVNADVNFSSRRSFMPGARGAASELIVCADLLAKGLEVFRAVGAQAACDLVIIDEQRRFFRVEVKSVTPNQRGVINCDIRRNIGNFDLIAFVFEDGRIAYRTPDQIQHERYPLGAKRSADFGHPLHDKTAVNLGNNG